MADTKGWICLHRKIQECSIWDSDESFDRRSAWIDLLLLANHEDKRTMFDGKPVVVKRGQRITSVRQLAERWHWGNNRTLNFLKMLENEQMIVKESDNRRTLLTIVNYGVYNDMPNTDRHTDGTLTDTQTEHCQNANGSQTTINNNENNENNETNNNTPLNPPKGKRAKKESNLVLLDALFQEYPNGKLSDEVISVLREWMEYKDQRKEQYVKKGMQSLLNQVYKAEKEHGSEAVIERIRNSMASNYRGVTLDGLKTMKPTRQTNQQKNLQMLAEYQKKLEEEGE